MSTLLQFHRELDEKMFLKIGYSEQPLTASYRNENNEIIEMEVEPEEGQENTFQLADPRVHWDPEVHDLRLKFNFEIENPQFLFGENGLADNDGVLGIAVRWHSRDAAQRQIEPVEKISYTEEPLQTEYVMKINKGILRGKVTFEVIIYLAVPGSRQSHLASGTILGILGSSLLLFDGNSSMFPILEVNDPAKPLWWVDCDFDDAMYDPFNDESVAIVINTGHKHSRHLKIEKGIGSSPMLLEILATGMQVIIDKAKQMPEWEDIKNNNSEAGSIGEAIYYFINTFSWDTSSPENLARSIREDFDRRF